MCSRSPLVLLTAAMKFMMILEASVFPAPLSPLIGNKWDWYVAVPLGKLFETVSTYLIMIHWLVLLVVSERYAAWMLTSFKQVLLRTIISQRINVRWSLVVVSAFVLLHSGWCVNVHGLERINRDYNVPNVRLESISTMQSWNRLT